MVEPSVRPTAVSDGDAEPTSRRIAVEVLVFALLFLVVGAAIVTLRVMKDGPQVLDVQPHRSRAADPR